MTSITRSVQRLFPKDVGENDVLSFDYTESLVDDETVDSAVITVSTLSGVDASPSSMLSGSPQATSPFVLQAITDGVRNVEYLFYCKATTSSGRVLVAAGVLPVILSGQD